MVFSSTVIYDDRKLVGPGRTSSRSELTARGRFIHRTSQVIPKYRTNVTDRQDRTPFWDIFTANNAVGVSVGASFVREEEGIPAPTMLFRNR